MARQRLGVDLDVCARGLSLPEIGFSGDRLLYRRIHNVPPETSWLAPSLPWQEYGNHGFKPVRGEGLPIASIFEGLAAHRYADELRRSAFRLLPAVMYESLKRELETLSKMLVGGK